MTKQGAPINFQDSPLMMGLEFSNDEAFIRKVLEIGADANQVDTFGRQQQFAGVLRDLLMFGAHLRKAKFCHGNLQIKFELLEFLARQSENCIVKRKLESYRMLMKFFLLQNPECDIRDFERTLAVRSRCENSLLFFMNCMRELAEMDSLQVGHGHTFCTFVSRGCLSVEKTYDVNQILLCLMKNTFPVYFDVISARIGRSIMKAEVKKLQVYTSKIRPNLLYGERFHLSSDVVSKISKYLSDDDLLKFILAFYKPINQNNCREAGKGESVLGKRNSEPSSKHNKHPRLHR